MIVIKSVIIIIIIFQDLIILLSPAHYYYYHYYYYYIFAARPSCFVVTAKYTFCLFAPHVFRIKIYREIIHLFVNDDICVLFMSYKLSFAA